MHALRIVHHEKVFLRHFFRTSDLQGSDDSPPAIFVRQWVNEEDASVQMCSMDDGSLSEFSIATSLTCGDSGYEDFFNINPCHVKKGETCTLVVRRPGTFPFTVDLEFLEDNIDVLIALASDESCKFWVGHRVYIFSTETLLEGLTYVTPSVELKGSPGEIFPLKLELVPKFPNETLHIMAVFDTGQKSFLVPNRERFVFPFNAKTVRLFISVINFNC